jgi:general secretion pathway protein M
MAIQMNKREKYAVGIAGSLILLLIVYQFMVSPFIDGKEKKRKQIVEKLAQLEEMNALKDEYLALLEKNHSVQQMAGGKDKGFTLFSFLEKLASASGVKDNISYMKPSKSFQKDTQVTLSLVEIKLQNVDMKKLMGFLYNVETSPNSVFVRGISLTKTGKEPPLLNAILQIETVENEG